ncbi:MAG TPA: hypothetical protein VF850_14465 [Gemmatimonadaceae bacterium]
MTWSRSGITLALAIIVASTRSLDCQQLRLIEAGVHTRDYTQVADTRPSAFSLSIKSIGGSVGGSLLGGTAGLAVDQAYCERHHGKEPSFLFGPCFLYANEGFAAGWFGGAIVGSTLGAVRVAEKRGCARGAAILRAAIGATIGAAPGLSIVAKRSGKYPPSRSIFIAGAPILSGLGAAAAVVGCHAT